jgi:hypothetical protein
MYAQGAPEQVLGALLSGKFPSYFAGKEKPSADLPDMPLEAKEARVLVIGDSDLGSYLLQFNGAERNQAFILQIADWLSADQDVAGISRRAAASTHLDRITNPEKAAAAMNFSRILGIGIVPFIVIAAAVLRLLLRRRKETRAPKPAAPPVEDVSLDAVPNYEEEADEEDEKKETDDAV